MVTEQMDGVDLCEEIVNRVNNGFVYSEAVASHYVRQVFEALAYIHERNIIHRDMKPHNIILASRDDTAPIKITDFSVAIELPPENFIRSGRIGTPHFMAPEVVKREPYDCAVDIWGCGVVLYILLSGAFPFHGTGDILFDAIVQGSFSLKSRQWQSISERACDLVFCMLAVNPKDRITADGVLSHPWLLDRDRSAERTHLQDTVEELRKFNARKKLKGEVMASLARRQFEGDSDGFVHSPIEGTNDFENDTLEPDLSDSAIIAQLIDSLDEIQLLAGGRKDDILFLQWLFEIPSLYSLLEIHSKVSHVTHQRLAHSLEPNAVDLSSQVVSAIEMLENPDETALELKELLNDTHIMALMTSYDQTLQEVQSGGIVSSLSNNVIEQTDSIAENLTRVRLVQFTKSGSEPLGVTLKINDDNKCVVARIIHGGMIHRQGTLHVGDEIKEINGISVARQSVENLQAILREATGDVTFKIVPNLRNSEVEEKKKFVRALFDYDPRADDFIPCQQAGIAFKRGEILQIVSQTDTHWWQAIRAGDTQKAGLVPSPELQELKIASHAVGKSKKDGAVKCFWKGIRKKKKIGKYIARHNSFFDQLDLLTYEEVTFVNAFRRKTIVLIGAHGVGRRHIKNSLIARFSERYAYPIPHTSREPRPNEEHGKQYYFVSEESMLMDTASHQFLEYGTHENAMYGTKLDTIRDVINNGYIAVLDVEPPALKLLRCAEFAPYVVFIAAPTNLPQRGDKFFDESLNRLVQESESLKEQFGHLFNLVIINHNIEDTIEELACELEDIEKPQWVPASWLY
ncbi:peripheral plasma membrane protein CASK-like isoform X2 [Rhopilema esculentum]